jgi:inorganic triphosphatase YgiF
VREILTMTGSHLKLIARANELILEVSWDTLTLSDSGISMSEVEVELVSGGREAFDRCMAQIGTELELRRETRSKLQRALEASRGADL